MRGKLEDKMSKLAMRSFAVALMLGGSAWPVQAHAAEVGGAAAVTAADIEAGKRVWSQAAGCTRCHGWAGDGTPEGPGFPTGANLRRTSLDAQALAEVIKCGVPGSEMPSFNRNAYGTLTCFGMNAAQVGAQKPPAGEVSLSDAQVNNLVAYLMAKVVGKAPADKAACQDYYGATSPICNRYP